MKSIEFSEWQAIGQVATLCRYCLPMRAARALLELPSEGALFWAKALLMLALVGSLALSSRTVLF